MAGLHRCRHPPRLADIPTGTYLVVGADKSGPKSTKEKAADKLIGQGAPIRILSEEELVAILEGGQARS